MALNKGLHVNQVRRAPGAGAAHRAKAIGRASEIATHLVCVTQMRQSPQFQQLWHRGSSSAGGGSGGSSNREQQRRRRRRWAGWQDRRTCGRSRSKRHSNFADSSNGLLTFICARQESLPTVQDSGRKSACCASKHCRAVMLTTLTNFQLDHNSSGAGSRRVCATLWGLSKVILFFIDHCSGQCAAVHA